MNIPMTEHPQYIRNEIRIMENDLRLMKQKMQAFRELGKKHRALVDAAMLTLDALAPYLQAHKANEDAEAELMQNEMDKLSGQIAIHKARLEQILEQYEEQPDGRITKRSRSVILPPGRQN